MLQLLFFLLFLISTFQVVLGPLTLTFPFSDISNNNNATDTASTDMRCGRQEPIFFSNVLSVYLLCIKGIL